MDARQAGSERGGKKYMKATAGETWKVDDEGALAGNGGMQVDSRASTPAVYKL